MTTERAKEILYDEWQGFLENNLDYAGISEAYKMALNALDQMSKIEDIKAEISELSDHEWIDARTQRIHTWEGMKKKVLEIINKHIGGDADD